MTRWRPLPNGQRYRTRPSKLQHLTAKRLINLLHEHGNTNAVAKALGCYKYAVYHALRRLGVPRRPRDRMRAMSDDALLRALLVHGNSIPRLSRRFLHVNPTDVRKEFDARDLMPEGDQDVTDAEMLRVLRECDHSLHDAAAVFGIGRRTLVARMVERGLLLTSRYRWPMIQYPEGARRVDRRKDARDHILKRFTLDQLRAAVSQHGLREAARKMRVAHTTLLDTIRRRMGVPSGRARQGGPQVPVSRTDHSPVHSTTV